MKEPDSEHISKLGNGNIKWHAAAQEVIEALTATPAVHAVSPLKPALDPAGPSAQARLVVAKLWPEIYGTARMGTAWGEKSQEGLARSIDEIAGIPDLLAENAELLAIVRRFEAIIRLGPKGKELELLAQIDAALDGKEDK